MVLLQQMQHRCGWFSVFKQVVIVWCQRSRKQQLLRLTVQRAENCSVGMVLTSSDVKVDRLPWTDMLSKGLVSMSRNLCCWETNP